MAEVGSSMMMIRASCDMAFAISTIFTSWVINTGRNLGISMNRQNQTGLNQQGRQVIGHLPRFSNLLFLSNPFIGLKKPKLSIYKYEWIIVAPLSRKVYLASICVRLMEQKFSFIALKIVAGRLRLRQQVLKRLYEKIKDCTGGTVV